MTHRIAFPGLKHGVVAVAGAAVLLLGPACAARGRIYGA
jgi:hypothetical protein